MTDTQQPSSEQPTDAHRLRRLFQSQGKSPGLADSCAAEYRPKFLAFVDKQGRALPSARDGFAKVFREMLDELKASLEDEE